MKRTWCWPTGRISAANLGVAEFIYSNGRKKVPKQGQYRVSAIVQISNSASGTKRRGIIK